MSMSFNILCDGIISPLTKDVCIKYLSLDSREVKPSSLFIALKGAKYHGLDFANKAIENGALVILYEADTGFNNELMAAFGVPTIAIENLNQKLSKIAARFYGHPSKKLQTIAITGTNGKSSIAYSLAAIFDMHMSRTGVVGTVGFGLHNHLVSNSHTTPNAIDTQKILADLVQADAKYLMIEASSHGLDQGRLNAVKIQTAVFTNLSHDHLDYHQSMQAYFDAKAKLFHYSTLTTAIINANDKYGQHLISELPDRLRLVRYGVSIKPIGEYLSAESLKGLKGGVNFMLKSSWGNINITLNLLGQFNVENALAMIAVYLLHGGLLHELPEVIKKIKPLNGRMQCFGGDDKPLVVVDFAHTPDALSKALSALRFHMKDAGKLYCVFGCGGDRDNAKRPMMAQVAEEGSDFIIITDDNPRYEPSEQIISQIIDGISDNSSVRIIPDRHSAIVDTVQKANADDVVLVAGKGHETYQMIGDVKHPFCDQAVVQESLC